MGIFNKILKKKEQHEEGSQKSKTQVRKKAARREPPSAPTGGEDLLAPSHEFEVSSREPPLEAVVSPEKSEKRRGVDEMSSKYEEPPLAPRKIPAPIGERGKPSDKRKGSPPTIRDTIVEAETRFAEAEAALTEFTAKFQRFQATFAPLKIFVVEGKIKLAEANIKLAEAEIDPQNADVKLGEIEGKIVEAEMKITEAERTISALTPQYAEAGSILGTIKIKLASVKIALAEIKIELVQGNLSSGARSAPLEAREVEPESPHESVSSDSNVTAPSLSDNMAAILQARSQGANRGGDSVTTTLDKVKISPELQTTPGGDTDKSTEKVLIDVEDSRVLEGEPEPKEKVVMEGLDEDTSPFETGINLKKVTVSANGAESTIPPAGTEQPKVTIKSDERESAWVAADGTLKNAPAGEGAQERASDDARPHITFRQSDVEKRLVTEDLNKKGIEFRKSGQWEEALAAFDRVLEIDPENEAAWHNKGVALRTSGRYEEALTCFNHVLKNKVDNPIVWFNKSFVLSKLNRYEEALTAFDKVIELQPNHAAAWYNRGKILEILGKYEEAEKSILKAKELGH